MSTQDNLTLGKVLLESLSAHDLSRWEAALASDFTFSYPGMREAQGKEAAKMFNASFLPAFSDLHFAVQYAVADGETVVYKWRATGTHDGPLATPMGTIPPSGKKGDVVGVLIATVKNGKIAREETYWNIMDLLAQIGALPTP